eukprot:14951407-Ditylum_brightwellii.AAC.1
MKNLTITWFIRKQKIGVQAETIAIDQAKLAHFNNNPGRMLDEMEIKKHYVNNEVEFNKVDPKDAAIIALTTKLNTLETKMKSGGPNNSTKQSGKGSNAKTPNNSNGNNK